MLSDYVSFHNYPTLGSVCGTPILTADPARQHAGTLASTIKIAAFQEFCVLRTQRLVPVARALALLVRGPHDCANQ
jgi:hypothetical protein